jgi:segregation and condensation protein A
MVEEYKLIKDEMDKLAETEVVDRFYKLPDSSVGEFRYELPENLSVDALIKSFSNLMQKMAVKAVAVQEKKIQKDRFTVAQKIAQIKDMLIEKKEFQFTELFEDSYSKSEIINTFLALLELLKTQYINVIQNSLFDDILVIRNDDIKERLTEEDIGSEYDGEN